ncbi:MAG: hypothetical protein AB2693_09715 [Candidatus Thiodiazotropha sp.]
MLQSLYNLSDEQNEYQIKYRQPLQVFGFQHNSMGGKFVRTIGLLRAR